MNPWRNRQRGSLPRNWRENRLIELQDEPAFYSRSSDSKNDSKPRNLPLNPSPPPESIWSERRKESLWLRRLLIERTDSMTLADVQTLNRVLVTSSASITEINTVRKHVSAIKGGRLAQAAYPAQVLTLAISDVPVGQESAIASGPTVPDPTTREQVASVIKKYELQNRLPKKIIDWIASAAMPETPKAGDVCFERTNFQLVLGMHELFHAAHRIAEAEDYLAFCDNSTDDWPVEKATESLLAQLEELREANPRQPVALIADGELSSAVTGGGVGGRNAAFVLACVEKIAGKGITVLSAGTDGIDGNSSAAGAVADGETLQRASQAGLDPREHFRRSDSFTFFHALGDAIVTGPTGNNLRDMRILIAFPRP